MALDVDETILWFHDFRNMENYTGFSLSSGVTRLQNLQPQNQRKIRVKREGEWWKENGNQFTPLLGDEREIQIWVLPKVSRNWFMDASTPHTAMNRHRG